MNPDWIEVEATILDNGRRASIMRVPDGDDVIEIVLELSTLGQLVAEADGIRETAMAWG